MALSIEKAKRKLKSRRKRKRSSKHNSSHKGTNVLKKATGTSSRRGY